ncbi:hypothetical protein C7E17_27245, partial [Stenotrophomonas maltophilia]
TPKPTYYRVAPAAGVNASASDMAQWLLAHTGHPTMQPRPGRHPGQLALGASARAQPQRLGVADTEADL